MQLKLAIPAVLIVVALVSYMPAYAAADYPFVSTWGKQGLVNNGVFMFPQYVAVDEAGNVYATDLGNFRVQKFDNEGEYLHSWGSKGSGPKQFSEPAGIAVKNNFVYVVDHDLGIVKKFDPNGNLVISWGNEGKDAEKLKLPNGIAVSSDNHVYVADTGNSRVQKYDSEGKFVKSIGSSGQGDGQFLYPLGVAVDSDGNVYIADSGNNRIQKFNSEGVFMKQFKTTTGGLQNTPDGVAVDKDGNVISTDSSNNRIVIMDKNGAVVKTIGATGTGNSQFKLPKGAALDSDGDLFVIDSSNHRIQKFGTSDKPIEQTQTETQTEQPLKPVPNDFAKPTVVPPKNMHVEATGGLTPVSIGKAIAEDPSGIKSLTHNAPAEFPLGVTTVIWTAIDGAGNVGMATQTVTVSDSTPPVISNISDIVLEAKGTSNGVNLGNPTTNDVVGVLSVTNDAPDVFPIGETIVTWTATDVANNIATKTQRVTISDSTPPKIKAPSDVTIEASDPAQNEVNLGEPTVSDNGEVSSITNDSPPYFALGETEVVWTATDTAGNVGTAIQRVIVTDTGSPVIEQPAELTVEAVSDSANPVTLNPPNVTDVQEVTITNDAPELFPLGQTLVTWTAVDPAGNNSTITQMVNVVDTTQPTLIPPEDITQEAAGPTGNIVPLGEPAVDDTTGISSVSSNAPESFPFGQTIVTWTATDNHGNSVTADQTVTIIDTTPPSITSPKDITVEAASTVENVVTLGEPKISDLVELESITNDAPPSFSMGQTTVTWTVTDTSGNTATATQLVSVVDSTPPALVVPEDKTVEATDPAGTNVQLGDPVATDAIGVGSITNDAPSIFGLGTTPVTWTATDTSGNVITEVQNITIVDTTAPTIAAPEDITLEATSSSDNAVSLVMPDAADTVSEVTITNDAPDVFPLGETTVTWTATDAAGNAATATQLITIEDTTPPVISTPEDITMEATSKSENSVTLESPNATDNVEVSEITNNAPEFFPVGQTTVTWTATDSSGLIATVDQVISVVDTTSPTITISDITVEATSEDSNEVDLGTVETSDAVDVVSVTNDAPPVFPLGVTTVTWTAEDEAGNTATATQTVTIEDTTPPTIAAPADITAEATSSSENTVSLVDPEVSDEVSDVTITNDAPELFALGDTTITWTATDISGNNSTITSIVTIVDTTAPTIVQPENITAEATSSSENTVSLTIPEATDDVSDAMVSNDAPAAFPLGETTVTWTATDEAGNTATVTQLITIQDTTAPAITAPENITMEAESKSNNAVTLTAPNATDNVGVSSITNDAPEFFPVGQTTVTWTATDSAGNTQTASQLITIIDTVPPKFALIADITEEATSADSNEVSLGAPEVSDILDITSISNDAPPVFPIGETTVTWTAEDEAGNVATATQLVSIVDTTSPELTIPENIVIDAVSFETPVTFGTATSTDLTDNSPVITNDAPEIFALGQTVITWTATDSFGNSINQTQTVTVQACGKPVDSYNMIMGTDEDDVLSGTTFADLMFGLGGDDMMSGGDGADCIFGGDGEDILSGGDGADTIHGEGGADILKGQSGNDRLIGATGNDIVDGGEGTDSCVVTPNDNDVLLSCESQN